MLKNVGYSRNFIIEQCCALKYYPEIEICVKEQKGEQEAKRKEAQRLEDENFGNHLIGRVRTYLWNLFEYPETSKAAQVRFSPIERETRAKVKKVSVAKKLI